MGRSGTFVYLCFKDIDGAIWYDWILFFSFFKIFYFIIYLFFTLQYCIGFAIHQHESAMRKFTSVQSSVSVVSDSLRPHGLQHARFPCLLPTLRACSNSCPLSQWCHPTTSSSVVPFSSHLQSFPASGSFPMSQFLTSCGQIIGASASTSVLPMNIQGWFPVGLIGLISLQSKRLWRVFSSTTIWKHQFFSAQASLQSNSHIHTWVLEKPQLWLDRPVSAKWCLCFLKCCLGLS